MSNLRSYERAELMELASSIPGYRFTYREIPFGFGARAVAFFGVPESLSDRASTEECHEHRQH